MGQWTTVVDQPPFFPVFNAADNALDGFDVNGVQGSGLRIKRSRRHSMSIAWVEHNLPNNSETNVLGLLRFKLFAFGNGNDDDAPKLPKNVCNSRRWETFR